MTDKPLTPAVGAAGPNIETPAMAERPTIGVMLEEGTPGFGHATLSRLRDAPAGETITIGRPDANKRETVKGVILDQHGAKVLSIDLSGLLGEAGIAEDGKPVLLNAGGGSFLVSWRQRDRQRRLHSDAAMFRETAPGLWIAPEQASACRSSTPSPGTMRLSCRQTLTGASST